MPAVTKKLDPFQHLVLGSWLDLPAMFFFFPAQWDHFWRPCDSQTSATATRRLTARSLPQTCHWSLVPIMRNCVLSHTSCSSVGPRMSRKLCIALGIFPELVGVNMSFLSILLTIEKPMQRVSISLLIKSILASYEGAHLLSSTTFSFILMVVTIIIKKKWSVCKYCHWIWSNLTCSTLICLYIHTYKHIYIYIYL